MIDIRTYGGPKFRSIHTYDLYSFSNAQTSLSNSNMKALVASYGDVIGTTSILSRLVKASTADFQGFAISSVVVSGENDGRKWYRDYRSAAFIGTSLCVFLVLDVAGIAIAWKMDAIHENVKQKVKVYLPRSLVYAFFTCGRGERRHPTAELEVSSFLDAKRNQN